MEILRKSKFGNTEVIIVSFSRDSYCIFVARRTQSSYSLACYLGLLGAQQVNILTLYLEE